VDPYTQTPRTPHPAPTGHHPRCPHYPCAESWMHDASAAASRPMQSAKVNEEINAFIAAQDEWFAQHTADRAAFQQKFKEDIAACDERIAALKEGRSDIYAAFESNIEQFNKVYQHLKAEFDGKITDEQLAEQWEVRPCRVSHALTRNPRALDAMIAERVLSRCSAPSMAHPPHRAYSTGARRRGEGARHQAREARRQSRGARRRHARTRVIVCGDDAGSSSRRIGRDNWRRQDSGVPLVRL
jgi:hypothetical protein